MLKVCVPYTIDSYSKLTMRQLQWPDHCPCCGNPDTTAGMRLFHRARATSVTVDTGVSRTTTSSGYNLEWSAPCCEPCRKHQKHSENPLPPALLLLGFFAIITGIGYALFDAGYSDNQPVVLGYAAFVALLAFLEWRLYRWVGTIRVRQAASMMLPHCTDPKPAIKVYSDLENIIFVFSNEPYAREFATLNGI